jgi:hypothetical protein
VDLYIHSPERLYVVVSLLSTGPTLSFVLWSKEQGGYLMWGRGRCNYDTGVLYYVIGDDGLQSLVSLKF